MATKSKKQQIEERLQKLHDKNGELTPDEVLRDAKSKSSPLHDSFLWDDKVAAQKHRLEIARRLIRSVRVFVSVEERVLDTPRYVHDPREMGQSYIEVTSIKGDVERSREVVRGELKRVVSALRRANDVAAAVGLSHEMSDLIAAATALTAKLEDEADTARAG